MSAFACPACHNTRLTEPLYELSKVPVQSVRLFDSQDSARQCEKGILQIVQCEGCGLVFNREFDPETQVWDIGYEETQNASARFRKFAEGLVHRLIERWQLRNKRVLEIGCGKGYFLMTLCEMGSNIGMGVDPSFDPARLEHEASNITVHRELFQPKHLAFKPDLIVCRHTLEHLAHPSAVLSVLAGLPDTPVFIDVPDLARVEQEGAFWDLYYEHCNYFSRESLTALLAQHGLVAESIENGLDGQYLMYFGRTGTGLFAPPVSRPTMRSTEQFQMVRQLWAQQLEEWHQCGESVVLWGGGSKAVAFLSGVGSHAAGTVTGVVDINPVKQGRFLPGTGHPVWAPEKLIENQPDHIVIMNPVYHSEIAAQVTPLGIESQLTDVDRFSA